MAESTEFDAWSAGASYDRYMGRWSRRLAAAFAGWLDPPRDADWIDVGCGTGALTAAVLDRCAPRSVLAIDASADFVAHARSAIPDPRARFEQADAAGLPAEAASRDVVASALVLNFLPDRAAALGEMQRVLRPDGLLGFAVWDYPGGGVKFLRAFWEAAGELDPRAGELTEVARFPFCTRDGVAALAREAGLRSVSVEPIVVATAFEGFEDYWHPFTLGAGPAPGYVKSLEPARREALRERLAGRLAGTELAAMTARAWAVKGVRPDTP